MSRGFIVSVVLVLSVVAPWVSRMGSVGEVLGGFRESRRPLVADAAVPKPTVPKGPRRKAPSAHTDYQMPAGTVVGGKLETTVHSATSGVGDQVDARLTESIVRDGVELIPAGSVMHGTVVEAFAANPREPRGRIAIAFFVIEHAATNSRAAIKTRTIALDGPPPLEKKPKPADVQLTAGQALNVVLTDPLLIRIPK